MKKTVSGDLGELDPGILIPGKIRSKADNDRKRRLMLFLVKVLGCVLIALLFLVAAFKPGFATVLSCVGVIVACSIAAILVDRRFGRGHYES